jgi:hypothetical protein
VSPTERANPLVLLGSSDSTAEKRSCGWVEIISVFRSQRRSSRAASLDHLVGCGKYRLQDIEAKRFRRLVSYSDDA